MDLDARVLRTATNDAYAGLGFYVNDEETHQDALMPFYEMPNNGKLVFGLAQFLGVPEHVKSLGRALYSEGFEEVQGKIIRVPDEVPSKLFDVMPGFSVGDKVNVAKKISPEVLEAASLLTAESVIPNYSTEGLSSARKTIHAPNFVIPGKPVLPRPLYAVIDAALSEDIPMSGSAELQKELSRSFADYFATTAQMMGYANRKPAFVSVKW